MNSLAQQRGMTTIGWLVVLLLVGFFALSIIRITPAYLEYFSIASVMESLQKEAGISKKPKSEIRKLITRRFNINNVREIRAKDIGIQVRRGKLVLEAKYEVRAPLIANIDVVTRFHKTIKIPIN